MTPYQPHLPPEAQLEELLSEEEVTENVDYLSNEKTQADETDSSAAESMVEELTKVDIHKFNQVLENISSGLKQATESYDNLRALLPQLPVHEVPD